jgi:Signal transduction histidine kinase involved in nitrogen fixation and metabolism regulation
MVYKRFYITIVLLAVLLATIPLAAIWVWKRSYMVVTFYSLIALWPAVLAYLIYYINKTNRDLAHFFSAFQYKDSTLVFSSNNDAPSFRKLHQSFNGVIKAFSQVLIEKEKDFIFFRRTIEHSATGILAISASGKVLLCNEAFLRLFCMHEISHVSSIKAEIPSLYRLIGDIRAGQQQLLSHISVNGPQKIAVKATEFMLEEEYVKLLSFQDIRSEVDQTELDAWQKLIRVLRHEIHNSVSPITLISSGLINQYEPDKKPISPLLVTTNLVDSTLKGLHTIQKLGKGLNTIVEQYRSLTQLPKPVFEPINLAHLLATHAELAKPLLEFSNIAMETSSPAAQLVVNGDEKMLIQVLLNLTKNAIEALANIPNGTIKIWAGENADGKYISVSDNGVGISSENVDQIFTPFFTTKDSGTGIGLSLSRQIMRLHGGTLTATSKEGEGATFKMKF